MSKASSTAQPSSGGQGTVRNAFTQEFLSRLDLLAEPDGAHEATLAGPWEVRAWSLQGDQRYAVVRRWESQELGDAPFALFARRETALLAAAVLPAVGRDPLFLLGRERRRVPAAAMPGFALVSGGEETGCVCNFDEDFVAALHVAAALVRSPEGLANLLEAAGFLALEQAGSLLVRRIGHREL
jgi:hypothetical protein